MDDMPTSRIFLMNFGHVRMVLLRMLALIYRGNASAFEKA